MVRKPQGYQSPRFGDEHIPRGAQDYDTRRSGGPHLEKWVGGED